jgi:hypothetical protein
LAAITQAGGLKSTHMPLQYAEKINAVRSGMARAAAASGREGPVSDDILWVSERGQSIPLVGFAGFVSAKDIAECRCIPASLNVMG